MRVSPLLSIEVRRYYRLHICAGPATWIYPPLDVRGGTAFLALRANVPEIRRCSYVYRDTSRQLTGRANIQQIKKCETAGSPDSKSRGNSLLAKAGSAPAANGREDRSQPIGQDSTATSSATRQPPQLIPLLFAQHCGKLKPLESEMPLTQGRHSPEKAKSPARKAGRFLIARAAALSTASKGSCEHWRACRTDHSTRKRSRIV